MIQRVLVLAAALVAVSAGTASATQLRAVRDTAIYDSPTPTAQLGVMPNGAVYEGTCQQVYCYVDAPSGADGWVIGTDLVYANSSGGLDDLFQQGFNFGLNLGGAITGNPPPPNTPPPQIDDDDDDEAQVCFYDRANFQGKSFCVYEGDSDEELPQSWNDRISSIRVDDGLIVEVCRNADFEGTCSEYDSDVSRLPSRLNDRISSFDVGS